MFCFVACQVCIASIVRLCLARGFPPVGARACAVVRKVPVITCAPSFRLLPRYVSIPAHVPNNILNRCVKFQWLGEVKRSHKSESPFVMQTQLYLSLKEVATFYFSRDASRQTSSYSRSNMFKVHLLKGGREIFRGLCNLREWLVNSARL